MSDKITVIELRTLAHEFDIHAHEAGDFDTEEKWLDRAELLRAAANIIEENLGPMNVCCERGGM